MFAMRTTVRRNKTVLPACLINVKREETSQLFYLVLDFRGHGFLSGTTGQFL
jgi:hypothetical protein